MSDKTSDKRLLPCPFCGGEATIHRFFGNYNIVCSECMSSTTEKAIKEEAIATWNTRKPMERIVERLEELRMAEYDYSDEEPLYTDAEDIFEDGVSSGKLTAYLKAIAIVKEKMG